MRFISRLFKRKPGPVPITTWADLFKRLNESDYKPAPKQVESLTDEDGGMKSKEVATATENPTIPVRIRQNHLTNSPNGAMNGDA